MIRRPRSLLFFPLWLCAAACGGAPASSLEDPSPHCTLSFSDTGDVRVFVVGHRQLVADAESYASYEASYRRHLDSIAPCLSEARPNLLVFPEDAGLVASLIGSRGTEARAETNSDVAFARILTSYREPIAYYQEHFDSSLPRAMTLAVSDVVWRAVTRTFGGMARDHGAWVLTSANVGTMSPVADATLAAGLGDPDLAASEGVFVAESSEVYNSALLFDPTGALAGRMNKVFLTEVEEQRLDLSNGRLDEPLVFDTPFARIGVAISKDAWAPPFMQRLEDVGADLVVQPEAFGGWTLPQVMAEEWLPDVFVASGWLHTQKYRTFLHNLTPQLTGNFFDVVFDGQIGITERARPGGPTSRFVGQDLSPGWHAVGPWVDTDPGDADGSLSLRERRIRLRGVGEQLRPGSGAAGENAYVDSLVASDLSLSRRHAEVATIEPDTSKPASALVDDVATGEQRNGAIGADASGRLLLAWQDTRSGTSQIQYATSTTDGATWEPRGAIAPGGDAQHKPSVCVAPSGEVAVVWQELRGRQERVRIALFGSVTDAPAAAIDVAGADQGAQWEPACAWPNGELLVMWTGFRDSVPHLRFARSAASPLAFTAADIVDRSSESLPRYLGAQLQPALSESGDAAWIDYRNGSWDVRYARWLGGAFRASVRIDGIDTAAERIHGEPRIATDGLSVLVAYTDLHGRRAHPDVGLARSEDGGDSWSVHAVVPGGAEAGPTGLDGGGGRPRFRPDVAYDSAGEFHLSFQDLVPEKSAIFGAVVTAGGASDPFRIDDTGDAPTSLTRPRLARVGSASVVVWEDDRGGAYRIAAARVQ